jgi:translin
MNAFSSPEQPAATNTLETIAEELLAELSHQDRLREEALALSRRLIRSASLAIRATHRAEFAEATAVLSTARQDLARLAEIAESCPLFTAIGYVSDAQKEYAEACLTYALIHGDPLPHPAELQVSVAPYLNALGETAGELRRSILDALRLGNLEPCEARLEIMQQIYDFLTTVDYPDALTGGLRRTTDALRRILENTRADWTTAQRQHTLQVALDRLCERLPQP